MMYKQVVENNIIYLSVETGLRLMEFWWLKSGFSVVKGGNFKEFWALVDLI